MRVQIVGRIVAGLMATTHLRPFESDDVEQLTSLINAASIADDIPIQMSQTEVVAMLGHPGVDPQDDVRLAVNDGEIVGYSMVTHRPSVERENQAVVNGVVAALYRTQGIGTELFEWGLSRATEKLRSAAPGLPRFIRVFAYDWQEDLLAFYAKHRLGPVRYYDEMVLPLGELAVVKAGDFDVEVFSLDRSDEARIAHNLSFADHWGSVPVDAESWKHWMMEATTRLEMTYLAVTGGTVIGVLVSEHYPEDERLRGRREGWIAALATVSGWRNRGVASALISTACNAYIDAGFTHAALGVDIENPTGATGLYSHLGFVSQRREVECRLAVV